MANIYRCSACPAWFDESEKSGVYRDGEGNNYLTCPKCRSNFQKFDFSVKEEIMEDKINEQKRLSGEISEEKEIEIQRLKEEIDCWITEKDKYKKECERLQGLSDEIFQKWDISRKEIETLEKENTRLQKALEGVLHQKTNLEIELTKKGKILKAIKSIAEV